MEIIRLSPRQGWEVVFRDNDNWLVSGKIVLVLSNDLKEIREVEMEPGKYIVNEWHNAYRPNGENGVVLVIEMPSIKTGYAGLK